MRHSDARAAGEMKFTFAPAGPSTGSDRSSLPRLTTSTSSTSSTRTTSGGKTCAAEGSVPAHRRARTVRVEVDHPDDVRPVRSQSGPDEHEAVGADAGTPRAHRPDVLDRPVGGARVTAVDHDEVVPRP